MSIFNRKKKKELYSGTINPKIMEGFLNKIKDIICIANYDGTIEMINNKEINKEYKTINEFLSESENQLLYSTIFKEIKEKGSYINDIEISKNNQIIRMYMAAYNVPSVKKIFFYIKDTSKYFQKEFELMEEIDKQERYLKSKDLFIANLSHEIRTPINVITGMIYFLKNTTLDDQQLEYITKLDDASNLLLNMVNGLLDLSEEKSYTKINSKVDLNFKDFISGLLSVISQDVKSKNLTTYINLDFDDEITVFADKVLLNQIFINLLENAIKYTEKGFIEFEGKKIEEDNISYKFQFCIKDTGIGIKKEDTLKIFKEFSQIEDPTITSKSGKGIGLAIAKKNVENMNGKMWVESTIGLGSKFYFNIVLEKSNTLFKDLNDNSSNKSIDLSHSKSQKQISNPEDVKILLVEDNDLNIEITTKIIEELKYTCEVAKDGIEAIKIIKEKGITYYNLILMDIHMPKYNGYEISKILKVDLGLDIPIVALTATNITNLIIKENKDFIYDYIQKPIKPEEFKEKLSSYMSIEDNNQISTREKQHIILLGDDDNNLHLLKNRLSRGFEVAITKSELEIQILLETGFVDLILIDELKDLNQEFKLINNIKSNSNFAKIPLILINEYETSDLKKRSELIPITGLINVLEVAHIEVALATILDKVNKETKLTSDIVKSKEEINNVYNFLFESMVNLTTSRSKETGSHLKRTQLYMQIMLEKYEEFYKENLFIDKKIIEDICMAAVLHDIGKVGIPDNVLNKPRKIK